jgi:hypothetical protein
LTLITFHKKDENNISLDSEKIEFKKTIAFNENFSISMQEEENRIKNNNKCKIEYNIYNIYNIISERKRSHKSPHLYHFREPLFSNFKNTAQRAHPQYTIVALIENFFEAYMKTFSQEANAQITLYQPLIDSTQGVKRILEKAELTELQDELTICLKILQCNPDDIDTKRRLRKTLLTHKQLIASTNDPEILNLIKNTESHFTFKTNEIRKLKSI